MSPKETCLTAFYSCKHSTVFFPYINLSRSWDDSVLSNFDITFNPIQKIAIESFSIVSALVIVWRAKDTLSDPRYENFVHHVAFVALIWTQPFIKNWPKYSPVINIAILHKSNRVRQNPVSKFQFIRKTRGFFLFYFHWECPKEQGVTTCYSNRRRSFVDSVCVSCCWNLYKQPVTGTNEKTSNIL